MPASSAPDAEAATALVDAVRQGADLGPVLAAKGVAGLVDR